MGTSYERSLQRGPRCFLVFCGNVRAQGVTVVPTVHSPVPLLNTNSYTSFSVEERELWSSSLYLEDHAPCLGGCGDNLSHHYNRDERPQ